MEKQKKSVGTVALVVLLLIVTIVSLVLATYAWAKYTTTKPVQNATAVVAKWDVNATVNGSATWTKTFNHVVPTKMAPGTSGVIPVTVDASNSEVCVAYKVYVTAIAQKPTHLKFYEASKSGETYTKGNALADISGNTRTVSGDNLIFEGTLNLSGESTHNAVNSDNTVTRYLMWEWPYDRNEADYPSVTNEAYDDIDTQEANIAAESGRTMTVSIKVVMDQVKPE